MDTSLVGNYIHLKYLNYRRYGLQTGGKGAIVHKGDLSKYLQEARQEVRALNAHSNMQGRLLNLETRINNFKAASKDTKGNFIEPEDCNLQALTMWFFNDLWKDLTAEDFDWETFTLKQSAKDKLRKRQISEPDLKKILNTHGSSRVLKAATLLKSSLGSNSKTKGVTPLHAFNTQVNNLKAAFQAFQEEGLLQATEIHTLTQYIENLERAEKNFVTKSVDVSAATELLKPGENSNYSVLELIRATAKLLFASAAFSLIEGDFFESILAASSQQLSQVGAEGFEDIIDSFVSGSDSAQSGISSENFSKNIDFSKVFNISKQGQEGPLIYSIGSQKGKVDVVLKSQLSQMTSGINAKSYNLNSRNKYANSISVVSNTNLLYLFQKKGEFLNHYLNQTVDSAPSSSIIYANQIMRQMILLQAIVGNTMRFSNGKKLVNISSGIFALNDKTKGSGAVRLYSVNQMFEKIIQGNYYDIDNLPLNQTWDNTKSDIGKWHRIDNILSAVRKQNISASIKKNFFTQT